jgi:glycine cleavage system aminomethyltransferase T
MNPVSPSPLLTIGPRVRKSPFYDATVKAGAKAFTIYNHMFMPTSYGDTTAEYWAIVKGVSLWDVAAERQIEISGPDAVAFTQLLTPRDIESCGVNRCRYVIFLDDDAGIINDAVLYRLEENRFWLSPGDSDVLLWAKGIASMSGMDVTVREPDASPLQLQGPLAPRVAKKLFGDIAIEMGYFHCHELNLDGIPVVLSRTGWSGELGYEIILLDGSRGTELWDRCMAAGAEFDIQAACPSLARSTEGALLSYASDITMRDNPFTIGMDRLLNIDKPHNYVGKAALQAIAAKGTERRLVGANFGGDPVRPNEHFMDIRCGDDVVGHVTRYVFSPRLEHNIALVNLPKALAEPGTRITIDCGGEWREAEVVAIPWFESEKVIPAF